MKHRNLGFLENIAKQKKLYTSYHHWQNSTSYAQGWEMHCQPLPETEFFKHVFQEWLNQKEKQEINLWTQIIVWWLPVVEGMGEVEEGEGGISIDGWNLDLGWRTHNTVYRWHVIELCPWNLYNIVNQCRPSKFNKQEMKELAQNIGWISE